MDTIRERERASDMETYPAVDGGPLCKFMDDPAYWVEVFSDTEDRQAVKRAIKRLPNRGGMGLVIKVEKDDVMGKALHTLLSSPHGRNLLHYELSKRMDEYDADPDDMIAQVMYQHLAGKEEWFKAIDERLVEDEGRDLRFLTLEGFAGYLEAEGAPSDPEKQKWLAGVVSAFAMVSPDSREELLDALVRLGAPYEEMFGPSGV